MKYGLASMFRKMSTALAGSASPPPPRISSGPPKKPLAAFAASLSSLTSPAALSPDLAPPSASLHSPLAKNLAIWTLAGGGLLAFSSVSGPDKDGGESCLWCNDKLSSTSECTKVTCHDVVYFDLIEACKVFLHETGRFYCYQCMQRKYVFPDSDTLKKHYSHWHSQARTNFFQICPCDASFYSKEAKEEHMMRTDRFRCPVNKGESNKQVKQRFLLEATKAKKVKAALIANNDWYPDKPEG